jgi:hypothetical protein
MELSLMTKPKRSVEWWHRRGQPYYDTRVAGAIFAVTVGMLLWMYLFD